VPILHLGVIDVPYATAPPAARRGRRRKVTASTVTTGDVATWLENRYHVMEIYYETHKDDVVAPAIENALQGAIESVMMGAPPTLDPFGSATSEIEDRMKQFIVMGEMDTLGFPGVPTQAAKDRASGKKRSLRFKNRKATEAAVSFYDSGNYESSMKAWVD
jgi:hypothetical protein